MAGLPVVAPAHRPCRGADSTRRTSTFSPGRTVRKTLTSSKASAQMFDGDQRRISPAFEIGVRPKGMPMTSRSGEYTITPGSTMTRALRSRPLSRCVSKKTSP